MAPTLAYTDDQGRASFYNPGADEYVWIPKDKAQDAATAGLQPETPQAYQQRQEAVRFDRPLQAGLEAAGRGLTLGLSDVLLTETGAVTPEELAKRQEYNPIAAGVGEVAGTVGGALIPGAPLARAAGLGAKAAAGAAKVAGTGLAGRAAGAVAKATLPAAAEGALIGAGQAVSEIAQTTGPVESKEVIRRLGQRSMETAGFGGAMGLGFLGIGTAVKGAVNVGRKALTAGRRPDKLAMAARRQLEGGADVLGETGASRLTAINRELKDTKDIMAGLRREEGRGKDVADMMADMTSRQRILRKEANQLERELRGQVRGTAATERTTTTTKLKPGEAEAVADEPLTQSEMVRLLRDEHEMVLSNYDAAVEASKSIRESTRRLFRSNADDVATETERTGLRQYLAEAQGILLKREQRIRKELADIGERGFAYHGRQLVRSKMVPESQTIRQTVSRKVLDPEAEAAALFKRESALTQKPQLDKDMLQAFAQSETPGVVEKFLDWRSAGTFFGWVMGGPVGAIIGGPLAGSRFVRELAIEPALAGIANMASRSAGTLSGMPGRVGPGILPAAGLSAADVTGLQKTLLSPLNDPKEIYSQAMRGYMNAGMDESHAHKLAEFQAGRTELLRDNLPQDPNDPVALAEYEDLAAALSNPQTIGQRMRKGEITDQDAMVLRRLFPDQAEAFARAASKMLDDPDAELDDETERALEILAGRQVDSHDRLMLYQNSAELAGPDQQPDVPRPIASKGAARAATPLQAIKER